MYPKNQEDFGEHVIINVTHFTSLGIRTFLIMLQTRLQQYGLEIGLKMNRNAAKQSKEFNWVSEENRIQRN
jgi:glutamate formiminotransferase